MKDPRVRRDGRCAHCRGERKLPAKRLYREQAELEQAELDPFCSATCCRAWRAERRAKENAA